MKVNAPFKTATGKSLGRFLGELRPFEKQFGRRISQPELRAAYNARFGAKARGSSQAMMVRQAMGLPQAMVKVVRNSGTTTGQGLIGQVAYLTRESKADDENLQMRDSPLGDVGVVLTAEELREKLEGWAANWRGQPALGHTTHMIASYPEGTDPAAAHEAALEFAERAFQSGRGGDSYDFVSIQHLDTDNPHTHFVINNRGLFEGKWFTIQRDGAHDVNDLRALQVETAAEFGIQMSATRRLERGLTEKPMLTADYYAKREKEAPTWGVTDDQVLDERDPMEPARTGPVPRPLSGGEDEIYFGEKGGSDIEQPDGFRADWGVPDGADFLEDILPGDVRAEGARPTATPTQGPDIYFGEGPKPADWGIEDDAELIDAGESRERGAEERGDPSSFGPGTDRAPEMPDFWDPFEDLLQEPENEGVSKPYSAPNAIGHRLVMAEHAQRFDRLASAYDAADGKEIADLLRETARILRDGGAVEMDRREMTPQDARSMETVEEMKAQLAENIRRGDAALARDANPQTRTLREIKLAQVKGQAARFFPERDEFQAFGRAGQDIAFVQDAYRYSDALPEAEQAVANLRYDRAEAAVMEKARSMGLEPDRVVARYQSNAPIPAELSRRWGRDEIEDVKRINPDYTDAQAQRDVNAFHQFAQRQYLDANRDIAIAMRERDVTVQPELKRPDLLAQQDREDQRAAQRQAARTQVARQGATRSDDRSR